MAFLTSSLISARQFRLRVAAGLYWGARGLGVGVGVGALLAYGLLGPGWSGWGMAAGASAGAVVVGFLLAHLSARPLRCGACGQPSLGHTGKAKHAYADKWLGLSHRARVAWDIVSSPSHSCMYCYSRVQHRGRVAGAKFPMPPGIPAQVRPVFPAAQPTPDHAGDGANPVRVAEAMPLMAEVDQAPLRPAGVKEPSLVTSSAPDLPPSSIPVPPLPVSVSFQSTPVMIPPASNSSFLKTPDPAAPPAFPAAVPSGADLSAVPPALPVMPDSAESHPESKAVQWPPVAKAPGVPPLPAPWGSVADERVGENPFVPAAAAMHGTPEPELVRTVESGATPPSAPARTAPVPVEPSSFFGPVRPPAVTALPALPPAASPFPVVAWRGETKPVVAEVPDSSTPPVALSPQAPEGLWQPQVMEAALSALQQGQKSLEEAFQTVLAQLRTIMEQMTVVSPVASVPAEGQVSLVPLTPGCAVPGSPLGPAGPFTEEAPALTCSVGPETVVPASASTGPGTPAAPLQPIPWATAPVPDLQAVVPPAPARASSAASAAPVTSPTGFRVYPPLHPVTPPVVLSAPVPLPAPVPMTIPVPLPSAGSSGLEEIRGVPAPPTPEVIDPTASLTTGPGTPSRRRPLPVLAKTLLEELGPTLAQAFAPAGNLPLLVEPESGARPAPPPVQPMVPAPFPQCPAPPPLPSSAVPAAQAEVPEIMLPASLGLPPLVVPPGNVFAPAPPLGGTGPVPASPLVPSPDTPAVPAPFSFLQPVAPSDDWPSEDLPAIPMAEIPPVWTRTRGKPSLS